MIRSTETTAPDNTARIARLAWLCAFVAPLLLATLLLGVKSAQAATSPPPLGPLAFDEEGLEEEDEGEFAEEECAIAREELEEGLLTEADVAELCAEAEEEAAGGATSRTAKCPIRSLRAHAARRNDRLRITIGYTTNEPTNATVQIRGVGSFKRHLGKSGVLRFAKRIGRKLPRKRIRVRLKLPSGGTGCPSRYLADEAAVLFR